jgi:hypothetical protein
MTDTKALSDSWRINRSKVPALEMANAIRALSKVIGSVHRGRKHKLVSFNTEAQSYNQESSIIRIDPTFATKSAPITPEDFDVLCGHAAHEAGHSLVGSDLVFKQSPGDLRTDHNEVDYESIARVGEEIVVDHTVARMNSVLGEYIKRGRKAYSVPKDRINWADIIAAWTAVAVYGHLPNPEAPTRVLSALKVCMNASMKLRGTGYSGHLTPTQRQTIYKEVMVELKEILKQDKIEQRLTGKGLPKILEEHRRKQVEKEKSTEVYDTDDDSGPPSQAPGLGSDENSVMQPTENLSLLPAHNPDTISDQLQEEIRSKVDSESEDITEELQKVASKHDISHNYNGSVIWQLSQTERTDEIDDKLYRELVWIRNLKHNIGQEVFRSEPHGLVDQRRLHRATIDGLVFKQKRQRPRKDLQLVLLLDASHSMRGENESVFRAAHTLHRIIPASTVVTYNKNKDVVIEVSSAVNKPSRKVWPNGETPSGLALLATAKRFPSALIIHFTDGDCNQGPTTKQAYHIIEEEYPNTSFIEVQYRPNRRHRKESYPEMVTTIHLEDLNEFPPLLRDAIKPWVLG